MTRTPRARQSRRLALLLPLTALAPSACVSYAPDPLDPAALLARIEAERSAPPSLTGDESAPAITLETAAEWLRDYGPSVQETLASWRTAQAVADTPTPWPNPTVTGGPQVGFGDAAPTLPATTWFASLGVSIPLGGRLGAQDDLNAARALAARLDAALELRQQYLVLRRDFAAFALSRARADLQEETADLARAAADFGRQLAGAGQLGALDVALLELESSRRVTDRMQADLEVVDRQAALAELCGMAANRFDGVPLESVPEPRAELPTAEELRSLLLEHCAELRRLRAAYEVAEKRLQLQVAKQYPDLKLTGLFDNEPGEDRNLLGLSLGIDLPLFDRNQPAIAAALKQRDEQRERYIAAARRALAEVDRARSATALSRNRREMLEELVAPRARANIELARQTFRVGASDALGMLEVQRSSRTIELELLDARAAELQAWFDLEYVVGHPLITFPGEGEGAPRLADSTDMENTE